MQTHREILDEFRAHRDWLRARPSVLGTGVVLKDGTTSAEFEILVLVQRGAGAADLAAIEARLDGLAHRVRLPRLAAPGGPNGPGTPRDLFLLDFPKLSRLKAGSAPPA